MGVSSVPRRPVLIIGSSRAWNDSEWEIDTVADSFVATMTRHPTGRTHDEKLSPREGKAKTFPDDL
ncbi:MAG TPA: hypothetical protein VFB12_24625 [Ktedonobacteraceae bacterium]|nr:hypothetical protein [Ktedonobacteraceae bacterium]